MFNTNNYEKKRSKSKGEKERYTHLSAEFQRTARRDIRFKLCAGELKQKHRLAELYCEDGDDIISVMKGAASIPKVIIGLPGLGTMTYVALRR